MAKTYLRLFRWCLNADGTTFCSRSTAERGIRTRLPDGTSLIDSIAVGGATYILTTHEEYIERRAKLRRENAGELQHRHPTKAASRRTSQP